MMRLRNTLIKSLLLAVLLAGFARSASAFSLLGPFKSWQVTALGYQLPFDIGGPMLGNEGYRWNLPTIYYAFDQSFITYFGKPGMDAMDAAMKIFNDLPKFSENTNDGGSLYVRGEPVPTDVRGPPNFSLGASSLYDLKSIALELVTEEMGLAEPTRWTWCLRGRNTETIGGVTFTNYTVVKLNYDPITLQPSGYVNGQLYDYTVTEPIMIRGITYADALESLNDRAAPYSFSAVADRVIGAGEYFFGLSHDDVGGLKYLYNKNNFATEPLLAGITGSAALGTVPWSIYVGTNVLSTNVVGGTNITSGNFVTTGIRPGVNKITFKKVKYDSLFSQLFKPLTNRYTETVLTNSRAVRQTLQRGLTQPDILFVAEDLGLVLGLTPLLSARTATTAWQNNDAINGNDGFTGDQLGGPGVITPQIRISFSDQLPYWSNTGGDFETGVDDPAASAIWASFDENTEVPVIYPLWLNLTLEDVRRLSR